MYDTYSEWRRLECGSEMSLLVMQIGPLLLATVVSQLARCQKSSWLSFTHLGCLKRSVSARNEIYGREASVTDAGLREVASRASIRGGVV